MRSPSGFFLFTRAGANEQFLPAAGLHVARGVDVTDNVGVSSQQWYEVRLKRRSALGGLEVEAREEDLGRPLIALHTLASGHRPAWFAFLAVDPEAAV